MTMMNMLRDVNGSMTYALPFSNDKWDTTLAAGVAQSLTVPPADGSFTSDKRIAIFSPQAGATIYVALNELAALPGVAFSETGSDCLPTARVVTVGDTLSFITADDTSTITVCFYDLIG